MSSTSPKLDRKLCIAPMLDWTDRHQRRFIRILTKKAMLYTEMVTTGAIIHGDAERYLQFSEPEHPLALQLGGSDPKDMAMCSKIAEDHGYDEVNINVGCPSDRVQNGSFGACLMAEPEVVAENFVAMQKAVSIPVTIKNRLAIDDMDEAEGLHRFLSIVSDAGCKTFIIHARKAWLQGLSPKQNRDVPPLNYDLVYQMKKEFPQLEIIVNGGISSLEESHDHLQYVDGVMIGREAYHNPYIMVDADQQIYGASVKEPLSRSDVLDAYKPYIEKQLSTGVNLKHISRHILGLFNGESGAKKWRRYLSENAHKPESGIDVIETAASFIG